MDKFWELLQISESNLESQFCRVKLKSWNSNTIFLPYYHIKHMPQILLILASQNTDMLRLLQIEFTEAQCWMKEVRHAIVQCYVKEPLLYHFTMSDVKEEVLCQSNWSAMSSCPGWFLLSLWPSSPLCFNSTQYESQGEKNGWFHKTIWVKMGLHHSSASDDL